MSHLYELLCDDSDKTFEQFFFTDLTSIEFTISNLKILEHKSVNHKQ